MSNLIQVSPFLHSKDLEAAIHFFTDNLGFETLYRQPGYAYLHRETVGFRLLELENTNIGPPAHRRFAY